METPQAQSAIDFAEEVLNCFGCFGGPTMLRVGRLLAKEMLGNVTHSPFGSFKMFQVKSAMSAIPIPSIAHTIRSHESQ